MKFSFPPFLQPMDASRILVFGGIVLVVTGMMVGEIYAIFISHVANAEIRQSWMTVVEEVAARNPQSVERQFDIIARQLAKRGRVMNTHSHMIAYGYLALVLAPLQPLLTWGGGAKRLLAVLLIAGGLLQTVMTFTAFYAGAWAHSIADAGAVVLTGCVALVLFGLLRGRSELPKFNSLMQQLLQSAPSRFLLRWGVLLVLLGMLFGLYYSWIYVFYDEVTQMKTVEAALNASAAGEVETAQQAVGEFRGVLSKTAITVAAHSHAIEFGMLAILVAFIQNFVFLAEKWKLRWCRVFMIGGFLLPFFVFNATIYGLVSAGFADLSGFLVVVALSAMAFGVIRYTGARDSRSEEREEAR